MTLADLAHHLSSADNDKHRWKLVWEFLEEYRRELLQYARLRSAGLTLSAANDVLAGSLGDGAVRWSLALAAMVNAGSGTQALLGSRRLTNAAAARPSSPTAS